MAVAAGGSSNGRTPGSGPGNGGSSPPPPAIFGFPASWPRSDRRVQHGSRAAPSSRGLGHGPLKAETRVRIPLGPPPVAPVVGAVVADGGGGSRGDRGGRQDAVGGDQ